MRSHSGDKCLLPEEPGWTLCDLFSIGFHRSEELAQERQDDDLVYNSGWFEQTAQRSSFTSLPFAGMLRTMMLN